MQNYFFKKIITVCYVCTVVLGVQFFAAHVVLAAAGDIIWTQTDNPSTGDDGIISVAIGSDGIYTTSYVGGSSVSLRIEKRSLSTGVVIWTQTRIQPTVGEVLTVGSDGIYVAGSDGFTQNQWFIEKRSLSTGAVIWTQTSNPSSGADRVSSVAAGSDGIYVVGYDSILTNYQWRIEKRSLSTGAVIWTQTSNPSSGYEYARSVSVGSDGIYVVGGDNSLGAANSQWRIEKRSLSTGAVIWTQTSNPSSGADLPASVAVGSDGIYVAGFQNTALDGYYDIYYGSWRIEKRSLSTGALIWGQVIDPTIYIDTPSSVVVDTTGVYVAGTEGYADDGYDYSYIYRGDWRIEKRSLSTGAVIWTQTSNPSVGPDNASAAVIDSSGIYVVGNDRVLGNFNAQLRIEKRNLGSTSCTGPFAASWTDPTITANTTKIRKVHIDELRSWIDNRRVDAGLTVYSWTDSTITANTTKIRKVHIDELRSAISSVYTTCGQAVPTWTDSTITANTTKIRKVHIDELRSAISNAL